MLRELDSRTADNGRVVVTLLWHDQTGELRLALTDGPTLTIVDNVAPSDASYAFRHPFVYVGEQIIRGDIPTTSHV